MDGVSEKIAAIANTSDQHELNKRKEWHETLRCVDSRRSNRSVASDEFLESNFILSVCYLGVGPWEVDC